MASTWQVPHSWFITFYVISVSLSFFWLLVLPLFRHELKHIRAYVDTDRPSTPFSAQLLANILLLIQGLRRLAECNLLQSKSSSTMWIGHWLMGVGFYIGVSIAVWIEGLPALLAHEFSIHDVEITAPSLRTFFSLLLFTFASGVQHDCHAYLASLKVSKATDTKNGDDHNKGTQLSTSHYQMPVHPAFNVTLTPHYLAECVIYSALTILAAPEGQWLNSTLLCATIFVIVNLGVTAVGTRKWYASRFGDQAVLDKWAMIPFVL